MSDSSEVLDSYARMLLNGNNKSKGVATQGDFSTGYSIGQNLSDAFFALAESNQLTFNMLVL
jgi:hypothetical protein